MHGCINSNDNVVVSQCLFHVLSLSLTRFCPGVFSLGKEKYLCKTRRKHVFLFMEEKKIQMR